MIALYEHELRIDEKALKNITDDEMEQIKAIAKNVSQRAKEADSEKSEKEG